MSKCWAWWLSPRRVVLVSAQGKPLEGRGLSFPTRLVGPDDLSVPFQRNNPGIGRGVGSWPEPGCVSSSDTHIWTNSSALNTLLISKKRCGQRGELQDSGSTQRRGRLSSALADGLFIGLKHGDCKMSQGARLRLWDRLGFSLGEMTLAPRN